MRVVVSLSTIPSRVSHLAKVLNSLLDQTYPIDQIYLNIPYWSTRENCPYPDLTSSSRIKIIRCEDYGPITKLIPVLQVEKNPETIIITVDDDVQYNNKQVEKLVYWAQKYPDSAIGSGGVIAGSGINFFGKIISPNQLTSVSVIEGVTGCAYRRKFFTSDILDYTGAPKEAFYHDDFWISGHLARKGIPRLVHPDTESAGGSLGLQNGLSSNMFIFLLRLLPLVFYFQEKGYFNEPQVAPVWTIFGYWIFIILLFIILLILLTFFLMIRK